MIYTIRLGITDMPIHMGGSGPDETTWYFDSIEQYNLALAKLFASECNNVTLGHVEFVPEDDVLSDAAEFGVYLDMQVAP